MSFCSNCGKPLDPSAKFCNSCGAAVAEINTAAAPAALVVTAPVPQVCTPVSSPKSKVLGFVGMGVAIGGLVFAVLGILYTLIGLAAGGGLGFGFSFAFSLFSMPLSIVGGMLCDRSAEMGNCSTACSVGTKMRIAGIIVSAVMLFLGFVDLMNSIS